MKVLKTGKSELHEIIARKTNDFWRKRTPFLVKKISIDVFVITYLNDTYSTNKDVRIIIELLAKSRQTVKTTIIHMCMCV